MLGPDPTLSLLGAADQVGGSPQNLGPRQGMLEREGTSKRQAPRSIGTRGAQLAEFCSPEDLRDLLLSHCAFRDRKGQPLEQIVILGQVDAVDGQKDQGGGERLLEQDEYFGITGKTDGSAERWNPNLRLGHLNTPSDLA